MGADYPTYPHGIRDEELRELIDIDNPLIIECGAHDGRDTKRFLDLWPYCFVVAFEPDPRPICRTNPLGFLDRIGKDLSTRVMLVTCAVANKRGVATLYRSSGEPPGGKVKDWDHSSSLQKPTGHLEWSPWCTFPQDKRLETRITSLDEFFTSTNNSRFSATHTIDLLWVDVQGGQLPLVRGAEKTLLRTQYVYMECHQKPMYEGEPMQQDLIIEMIKHKFEVVALYEGYNFLFERRGD